MFASRITTLATASQAVLFSPGPWHLDLTRSHRTHWVGLVGKKHRFPLLWVVPAKPTFPAISSFYPLLGAIPASQLRFLSLPPNLIQWIHASLNFIKNPLFSVNLPKFLPDFPREIQPHASVACCPARFSKPSDMLRRNSAAEAWL